MLEEPELSLDTDIVRRLPALIFRLPQRRRRQVFVRTHSLDLLSGLGIGGEEVIVLKPDQEGATATLASASEEVREMLAGGQSMGDAVGGRSGQRGQRES